jgi:1-acyl-sn-glycerol-3-phosphate acyltransferase
VGLERWKLVSLWFSQVARVTADNALRFFVCLDFMKLGEAQQNSAWYLVTALFILPAVVLAPFNGALSNSLPKSRVLSGSALVGLAVMAVFGSLEGYWLWCWGLISIVAALYGPTRYAMLPAAADDTRWPLTRITGLFEMGTFIAVVAGTVLILCTGLVGDMVLGSWNAATLTILVLYGFGLLFALPVAFPSDVRRADAPVQAVRGFFTDFRTIWRERDTRICLIGLSGLRGLIIGMTGAILPRFLNDQELFKSSATVAGIMAGGMALGALLAAAQKHPRRVLGLVPWGCAGLTAGLAWAAAGDIFGDKPGDADAPARLEAVEILCALFGIMAGLINVPLAATYQGALHPDARGNGMAVRNLTDYVCAAGTAVLLFALARYGGVSSAGLLWIIAGAAGLATAAAWWIFRREVVENLLEIFVFSIMYRFRSAGPGLAAFPARGPVLVVANHSAYLDPIWLGKFLPRSLIPMMTSIFFDQPLLRWIMVYLADAIRVEASGFRREVPELKTAVAALDAGKCLVVFPEGRLRRHEEDILRMFGQGVWHILRERPMTPVVVCWIEGGWGSYFSHWHGLPMKNKRLDLWYPLGVAVGEPQVLGEDILADPRKTRLYLMERCLEMRLYFGLPPVPVPQLDAIAAKEDE